MKTLYFFLFSFVFLGLSQSYAQGAMGGGASKPGANQGTNAPASGLTVNLRTAKTGAAKAIMADALKTMTRKGLRFQLLDGNGKMVAGGDKRVKYNEANGDVTVDVVGLPAAPKGKNFRLKITGADNAITNVDLK